MDGNNPAGKLVTLKQLAAAVDCAYESVRRLRNGDPVSSQSLNGRVCQVLGLDAKVMWKLQLKEKLAKRIGPGWLTGLPKDNRLVEGWPRLTDVQRERVLRIVEGMVLENEATEGQPGETVPEAAPATPPLVAPASAEMTLSGDVGTKAGDEAALPSSPTLPLGVASPVPASPSRVSQPAAEAETTPEATWLNITETQYLLRLPSIAATLRWLARHGVPRTNDAGGGFVLLENIERALLGIATIPNETFDLSNLRVARAFKLMAGFREAEKKLNRMHQTRNKRK